MLSSSKTIYLLLFVSSLLVVVVSVTGSTVGELGTKDGYDVGGIKPICYRTTLIKDPNIPDTDGSNYTAIELLNDGMYGNKDEDNNNKSNNSTGGVSTLPSCYNGTSLNVTSGDIGSNNRQLLTGITHIFRLTLAADVSQIDDRIALQALHGKSTIFFRLLLCDVIKQGFCRPLVDTRIFDTTAKKSDTDLNVPPNTEFANDTTRWVYNESETILKGIQEEDGLLVFSRWCRWTLRQIKPEQPLFNTSVNIAIQLPIGIRNGAYFFVGHTVISFDLNNSTILRYDVASAIPDNVVEVRDPPIILTVTDAMKIGLMIAIGIFGTIAFILLFIIITKRNHSVMKLAQGSFLGLIVGAAIMQIGCSYFFLPTHDIFCKLQGPLVIVPMTFIAACLVGRIWRVYKVLAVMNKFARLETNARNCGSGDCLISSLYFLARLPTCCGIGAKTPAVGRKSFRQAVSAEETMSLILILTLPQVVLQVVPAVLFDWELEVQLDESGNLGRVVCSESDDWAFNVGMGYAAAVYILAVIVAWISRTLPSAFNEKVQVFHAATISTLLAFMTISLISITSDPTTHPDVQVFLRSLLSIGVAVCVMFLIVWPKIQRVLSGEKVVMSNYLGADRENSVSITSQTPSTYEGNNSFSKDSHGQEQGSHKEVKEVVKDNEKSRIPLKKDDPMPSSIASRIVGSESLLRMVTDKFTDGRPLLSEEVTLLQDQIGLLYDELNRIEYVEDDSALGNSALDSSGLDETVV